MTDSDEVVCCWRLQSQLPGQFHRIFPDPKAPRTPDDLIDIAVLNDLHFHGATQQGVVFHLLGALCEFGKLGVVCVADTLDRSRALYEETIAILDRETGRAST